MVVDVVDVAVTIATRNYQHKRTRQEHEIPVHMTWHSNVVDQSRRRVYVQCSLHCS